jgi:hypothetical protein
MAHQPSAGSTTAMALAQSPFKRGLRPVATGFRLDNACLNVILNVKGWSIRGLCCKERASHPSDPAKLKKNRDFAP